ncbi:BLUF domain-containing protein [Arenimonas sp.]|uniref:BLUF domain-containing protein n=1 Tax=Arenimonas sp. TaxID=1872635 RepID=UPI0035B44515
MSRHLRLVYASRSTFAPIREGAGIHPEVARILVQSRRNNARQRIVGGLYFADGSFFQCLEGRESEVQALYDRLAADPRHRDVRLLDRREIDEPSFGEWAMKHVPNAPEVQKLLARHGRSGFDPHSFPPALVDEMVGLLLERPDVAPPGEPVTGLEPSARHMLLARVAVATGLVVAVGAAAASWLR